MGTGDAAGNCVNMVLGLRSRAGDRPQANNHLGECEICQNEGWEERAVEIRPERGIQEGFPVIYLKSGCPETKPERRLECM